MEQDIAVLDPRLAGCEIKETDVAWRSALSAPFTLHGVFFDEVEGLSLMSGGHDLMVTVNGRTFKDVAMFVAKRLSPLPGVLSTATHFVLKKYKERGVLFTDEEKDERGGV